MKKNAIRIGSSALRYANASKSLSIAAAVVSTIQTPVPSAVPTSTPVDAASSILGLSKIAFISVVVVVSLCTLTCGGVLYFKFCRVKRYENVGRSKPSEFMPDPADDHDLHSSSGRDTDKLPGISDSSERYCNQAAGTAPTSTPSILSKTKPKTKLKASFFNFTSNGNGGGGFCKEGGFDLLQANDQYGDPFADDDQDHDHVNIDVHAESSGGRSVVGTQGQAYIRSDSALIDIESTTGNPISSSGKTTTLPMSALLDLRVDSNIDTATGSSASSFPAFTQHIEHQQQQKQQQQQDVDVLMEDTLSRHIRPSLASPQQQKLSYEQISELLLQGTMHDLLGFSSDCAYADPPGNSPVAGHVPLVGNGNMPQSFDVRPQIVSPPAPSSMAYMTPSVTSIPQVSTKLIPPAYRPPLPPSTSSAQPQPLPQPLPQPQLQPQPKSAQTAPRNAPKMPSSKSLPPPVPAKLPNLLAFPGPIMPPPGPSLPSSSNWSNNRSLGQLSSTSNDEESSLMGVGQYDQNGPTGAAAAAAVRALRPALTLNRTLQLSRPGVVGNENQGTPSDTAGNDESLLEFR